MSRFWLALSAIIIVLFTVFLIKNHFTGPIGGDQIADATYLGVIGLVAASAVLGSGIQLTQLMRNIFIWLALIFALLIGYNNRYELQDLAHRLTAGIIPSSPVSFQQKGALSVAFRRALSGHFEAKGLVNGQPVYFMIDTGASSVVLCFADAKRIGIETQKLRYVIPVSTANGSTMAAPIVLDSLKIGDIVRNNVHALITPPDTININLLGMSFLNRLSGYTVRGDRLLLSD